MDFQIIIQLLFGFAFRGINWFGKRIYLEREYKGREAGLRTYSLVALGACLFTIISFQLFDSFSNQAGVSFDPSRVIQAIAIGIGFIGAGVIFRQSSGPKGLTTAAGLWVAAAIGLAIGAKLYFLAFLGTFLAILVLAGLKLVGERALKKNKP